MVVGDEEGPTSRRRKVTWFIVSMTTSSGNNEAPAGGYDFDADTVPEG
jgi:hypothetical protein